MTKALLSKTSFCDVSLKENVNSLPLPGWDSTVMSPSNCLVIYLEMTNPSPTPLVFILSDSLRKPKNLNSLPWFFFEMPIPVSLTVICRNFSWEILRISTMISTSPSWVNLSAFDWRQSRTCIILCLSVTIKELKDPRLSCSISLMLTKLAKSFILLSSAFLCWIIITSLTASMMSNCSRFVRNLPCLIYAKSSISWTMN